ncbi:hypothetical protein KAU34_02775 [candidate division WOR-3 bacterium]|nr:hypothetical protein [candidate division WOR-3 bacterium]
MSKSKVDTIEKIKPVIEEIVEHKLLEFLGDPDFGLELRPDVKKRLKKSLRNKVKTISAQKIAKELKLKW